MLLHYNENTNQLTRCYITNINDYALISKLNTLDKTLEEYNKSLQEVPNKVWYSQNCKSFAFYEPYLYSCVRRRHDSQINIYLCLNIKVCNKFITIMCAPNVAGFSVAYGLYLDSVPNDEASTIVQKYIDNYCKEEYLNQLSDDHHYNTWGNTIITDGEVNLDGYTYLINENESITLRKPSEDHIFNYVYINDCNTYVLPTKGSTLIEDLVAPKFTPQANGITEDYRQLGRAPRITPSMSHDFLGPTIPDEISMLERFMNELENEGLAMRELPDASILDELT